MTQEYSFDAKIIGKILYEELVKLGCDFEDSGNKERRERICI